MPYIYADRWADICLEPVAGENYSTFANRVVPGLKLLKPNATIEECYEKAKEAWAAFVLREATEVTVTLSREWSVYRDNEWMDGYLGDWEVKEVLGGKLSNVGVVYYDADIATTGASDEVFKVVKSKEDEQLVFGWANIAIDAEGRFPLDWDGDVTTPEHLEKAAYNFVLKYRATGEQHEGEVKGNLVESVMFTKEKQRAMGIPEGIVPEGWWVGFHIPDAEVFAKIKSGEYKMFSVEGTAKRLPLQD